MKSCIGVGLLLAGCSVPLSGAPPADLESTTGQVVLFRAVEVGAILRQSTASTYTLRRDKNRASIQVTERVLTGGDTLEDVARWARSGSRTYSGSARESGIGLELDLHDGADRLDLVCTRKSEPVAAATAVRVRTGPGGDCGDPGAWSPAATTTIEVLACKTRPATPTEAPPPPPDDPDEARWEREVAAANALRAQLTFGGGTGIEYLYVNDDCVIQGGGLRFIPPDGSIGKVRGETMP